MIVAQLNVAYLSRHPLVPTQNPPPQLPHEMFQRTRNVQTQRDGQRNNQRVELLLLIADHGRLPRIPPQHQVRPHYQHRRHEPSHQARKEQPLQLIPALEVLVGETVSAAIAAPTVAAPAQQRRRDFHSCHCRTHLGCVFSLNRSARTHWLNSVTYSCGLDSMIVGGSQFMRVALLCLSSALRLASANFETGVHT